MSAVCVLIQINFLSEKNIHTKQTQNTTFLLNHIHINFIINDIILHYNYLFSISLIINKQKTYLGITH